MRHMFHFFPKSSFARNYFNLPEIFNCQINGAHIKKKEFIPVKLHSIILIHRDILCHLKKKSILYLINSISDVDKKYNSLE